MKGYESACMCEKKKKKIDWRMRVKKGELEWDPCLIQINSDIQEQNSHLVHLLVHFILIFPSHVQEFISYLFSVVAVVSS